ncbi:MAG: septation protein IspZ, partial [Gammaproteobacteria bacterium]|nr:septation protein IspZ [Gammaproteobacteria bacterium]
FLADFLPLILFLGAYLYKDIYFAVIVLMIAMPIGLAVKYLISGKIDRIYLWSTIFLLVMGGATVYLRNPAFLYWKPTAFYWALASAFLLSRWIGEKVLVERFFTVIGKLPTDRISRGQWRSLNLIWVAFFVALGLLNIYVAYNYSEAFWVRFKVFGLMGITLVFMTAQTFWIVSRFDSHKSDTDDLEV